MQNAGRGVIGRGVLCGCLSLTMMGAVSVSFFTSSRALGAEAAAQQPSTKPAIPASQPSGDAPKFRCDEMVYNFGEAWAGDKVQHAYIVHNDGKATLNIIRVQPTCGCTLAGEFDKEIAPGKEGKIPIALNTASQNGLMAKTITVETNDPVNQRVILTIKGTVKHQVQLEPAQGAYWSRIVPGSPETITVKVTNNMKSPLKLELVPDQPMGVFGASVKEVDPGKVYEVVIKAQKPYREGQNAVQLRFRTGMPERPEITIPCSLFAPPVVEVVPASIVGTTSSTQGYNQLVTVRYNGEGAMKLLSVKPSMETFKAELKEQQPGKVYTVSLAFPAGFETPQTQPAEVVINTDVRDKETIKIPIRVRQIGMTESLLGKPAPAFVAKTIDGKEVRAGGATGKVQVIAFIATWCPHCKKQLPMIQRVAREYSDKGVDFLVVSCGPRQNTPDDVRAMAKQLELTLPTAIDTEAGVGAASKYFATSYPVAVLIGKNGILEAVHRGDGTNIGMDAFERQHRAELDLLVAGKTREAFPPMPVASASGSRPATLVQGPVLALDATRQEVGLQKPASTVKAIVRLRNGGNQPVTVNIVKPSEGLKIGDYPKMLAAGATGEVRYEFVTAAKPGEFSHGFTIQSNDPARKEVEIKLVGTVRPFLEVLPPTGVSFSRNTRTHTIPSLATLVYNGEGKVNYTKVESSSPKFEGTVEPIPNGPYAKLIVKAKPPFELGETKATLRVQSDCKEQPTIDVPVSLVMPARIEIVPAAIIVAPSQRLQRTVVTIRNNGDASLNILGVKCSNNKLHSQFYPDPDGMSYKLMVTIPPDADYKPAEGDKFTIKTDDPDFKEIVIPVRAGTAEEQAKAVSQAR